MKIYHEITQNNMVIHTFNCNLCCGFGIEPRLKWNSISWRIEFLVLENVEKMTNWLKGIEPHTFTATTIISITIRKLFYSRFSWPIERVPPKGPYHMQTIVVQLGHGVKRNHYQHGCSSRGVSLFSSPSV